MAIQTNELYDNKTYSLKRKLGLYNQFYVIFNARHHNRFCTNTYDKYLTGYTLFTLQAHGIFPRGKQS